MFEWILNKVLQNKPKEEFPKKSFHGGCHGCRIQSKIGTLLCPSCQYHEADWNKPNLNGRDRRQWWWKQKIKFWSRFTSKPPLEPVRFHGGCLGCNSQNIHGVKRCTGCQYFNGNWSLPDLTVKTNI